jgi:hypothetical protein
MDLLLVFVMVFLVDAYFYDQGHDTLFFQHKTDAEKEIQRIKIAALKRRLGQANDNE